LLIKSVSLVDRGIYTVKARNETGHCESVFNLIVDGILNKNNSNIYSNNNI
jgi:hypothetical protein